MSLTHAPVSCIQPAQRIASLTDSQLESGGISADLVRLSVGLEYVDDIIADLNQALGEA